MNKHYTCILVYFLALFLFAGHAQGQVFEWVKGSAGKGMHGGGKICSDYKSNIYLAEDIDGTFTLDNRQYNDKGFVILKYNTSGILVRSKIVHGAHVKSISAGLYGDCVVTGYYDSVVVFDTTHLKAPTTRNVFTARYDTGGKLLWVRTLKGSNIEGRAACADPYGNTYVAGIFQLTITEGSTSVVSQGGNDVFMAKYDTVGVLQWIKRAGGGKDDAPGGICTDIAGNLYVAGYIGDNATFAAINVLCAGGHDVFVAKYNSADGALAWAYAYGGKGDDEATAISADASGRTYVTGFFTGKVQFATMTLSSAGPKDIFLFLHTSTGKFQWAHSAGGANGLDEGLGLACDGQSNAYLTGHFTNSVNFDNFSIDAGASDNAFIAKYAVNGTLLWLKKASGEGAVIGTAICRNADDEILITGTVKGIATFDKEQYKGDSTGSLFISKIQDGQSDIEPITAHNSMVNIYPNPAHQQINIACNGANIKKVDMVSISGQLLYTAYPAGTGSIFSLPLNNIQPGMYIISVQYDNGICNQRIVVQ